MKEKKERKPKKDKDRIKRQGGGVEKESEKLELKPY